MHFSLTSATRKYFPKLSLETLSHDQDNLFCQPFLVSRLASEILRSEITCRKLDVGERDVHGVIDGEARNLQRLQSASVANAIGSKSMEKGSSIEGMASDAKKTKPRNSWNDMPKFLFAGAVSTVLSRTCIAPLERIKLECIIRGSKETWVDVIRWIWVSEGAKGFWKGNMLNLFRMVPFKSINFICYDMYIDCLLGLPDKKGITNHDRLVGGGISGFTATVLCLPLDTIRTRLTAPGGEALGGLAGCFFHMIRNEGFLSLYKGLTPALISMGPSSAIFYAVYDILKTSYLRHRKKNPHSRDNDIGVASTLLFGAIAGACAETATYPLEVMRRQLQLQQSTKLGLTSVFVKLIERDGIRSLFAGLVPSTFQVLPSAALSYLFYETTKSMLKIS